MELEEEVIDVDERLANVDLEKIPKVSGAWDESGER